LTNSFVLLLFSTVARQAKALEAKLRISQGEEGDFGEDDDEDEDKDTARERGWGAGKRAYYDADVADLEGSDEEEALADEEAEAIRLQRAAAAAFHADDFGADEDEESSDEEDEEEDDEEPTMGARAAGKKVEAVPRDDDARAAAVRQDALELSALVSELRSILGEVRGRLGPLLREVRSGELATAEGVSYLEAKHTLLVHYAASIVFYLLLKAEGRPVRDHPVIKRLVEVRAYLEKVRPIDKRLQYQIEKLLAAAQRAQGDGSGAAADDADALRHGPRPEALLANGGGAGAGGARGKEAAYGDGGDDGVYRPPRLNPVSMDLDDREGSAAARKERRREIHNARRGSRSTLVQELAAEIAGAPEEVAAGAPLGMDTVAALRQRQKMAARDAIEEELMVRVPLSRDERKQMKAQRRAGLSGKALLDNFVDDVADLVDGGGASVDPSFSRHRVNQKFGADLAAQQAAAARRNPRSGDADLPSRETLSDRRAKMDGIRAKNTVNFNEDDEFDGGRGNNKRSEREEDDFYRSTKDAAATKKRARKEAHTQPDLLPPAEDPTTQGARRINNAIDKNRGLTPHRNKELKNPRKKHRVKYAEANVRRRGQVQEVRDGGGVYGGEGTGIKSKISKSVKF
jgi:U3 small nucleolar RNA-associated protein 3